MRQTIVFALIFAIAGCAGLKKEPEKVNLAEVTGGKIGRRLGIIVNGKLIVAVFALESHAAAGSAARSPREVRRATGRTERA